mgnify:CR=1 FL=1
MPFNTQLLDGIVVFVAVASTGSFTRAAQATARSTSYISKEINSLENRLGARLMHRTTRTLVLTPEGERFYEQCQQIVNDAQQAEAALSGQQGEPSGVLKLSCPVSFGLSRLRPVLAAFTERYPKINLELELNDRKVDVVADGFDIVIRASEQLEDSSLISRRFMKSRGLVLASPDYLKRFGTPSHPEELTQHQTISYSNLKNPKSWGFKGPDGKDLFVDLDSRVVTNSPEMELSLCLAGQGITRLPRFNLNDEIETGQLVELLPNYQNHPIDVFLVYPSRKHMSSRVRCFIQFIMETFEET